MASLEAPKMASNPTEFKIPSREYGITADEAAQVLMTAEEIKGNKKLNAAALKQLKTKKKAIEKIT